MDGTMAHRFDLGAAPKGQSWPCLRAGCTEVFWDTAPVVQAPSESQPQEDPEWIEELRSLGVVNPRGWNDVEPPASTGIREVDEWVTYSQET